MSASPFKPLVDGRKLLAVFLEGGQHLGVEMTGHGPAVALDDYSAGGRMIQSWFVNSDIAQGIVLVGKVHDPAGEGNLLAFQAVRVAAAVPTFVVGQSDLGCHGQALVSAENLGAVVWMLPHLDELLLGEFTGLFENIRVNMNFANVVNQGLQFDGGDEFIGAAEFVGEQGAIFTHPQDVIAGILVVGFRCPGQGMDGVSEGVFGLADLAGDGFHKQGLGHQAFDY